MFQWVHSTAPPCIVQKISPSQKKGTHTCTPPLIRSSFNIRRDYYYVSGKTAEQLTLASKILACQRLSNESLNRLSLYRLVIKIINPQRKQTLICVASTRIDLTENLQVQVKAFKPGSLSLHCRGVLVLTRTWSSSISTHYAGYDAYISYVTSKICYKCLN